MEIKFNEFKDLYNRKEYDKIIETARNSEIQALKDWDYFYYAQALYKKGMYKDCLSCFKECKKKYPSFTVINNVMCWSLYHDKVKTFDIETGDKDDLLNIVDYAIKHCKQEQYSAYEKIISKTLDVIFSGKANNAINYKLGDKYLSLLEPSLLSDEEKLLNIEGKDRRLSSAREKWYTRKVKTLVKLEDYKQSIEFIDRAFNDINKFHNNGDHWLMYRKALCRYHLGDLALAESILKEELKAFNHWSFYDLLFKIYRDTGNQEFAFQYAAMAALYDREHKLRVTFYSEFAEYLKSLGRQEESELHIKLIELIREEEEWKEDKKFKDYEINSDIRVLSKKEVIDRLNSLWQQYKYANQKFVQGEVRKILPNGKAGFIFDITNKSYYFQFKDFIKRINEVQIGQKVEFIASERLDTKYNELKPNAIEIRII